jgi:hypothetical protein
MAFLTMRSKRQPVAADGNGFPLVPAVFGPQARQTFAIGCAPCVPHLFHRNRPKNEKFRARTDNRDERSPLPCAEQVATTSREIAQEVGGSD